MPNLFVLFYNVFSYFSVFLDFYTFPSSMNLKHLYKIVVALAAIFILSPEANATHNMGKDLQYECLGLVNGQMQYRVTVRYYRNCWDNSFGGQASTAPTTVSLQVSAQNCTGYTANYNLPLNPTAVPANGSEVSQLCPAQLPQSGCSWSGPGNPPYPGVQIYTYTGIVNIPTGCTNVSFGTTECCRNSSINNIVNPGSQDLSIVATVNNTLDPLTGQPYCNNSVAFTNQPVPFFCINSNVTFNHGAVDIDGDSLVYTLVNPLGGGTLPYNNLTFAGGWSINQPIRTSPANGFQFDSQTGQMQFTPGFQEQDVLAVRVDEYRNGVLVGSTMRDIQVVILNCAIAIPDQDPITNVQNGNQVDSLSVQVCPGTPLQFDISCTDPANHNLVVSSNINTVPSAIPGATMTQVGTGDTVIARIQWTPLPGDTGCHDFVLTVDNNDCPINGSYTRVYSICVFTKVQLLTASQTFCGTPVQLTASGGTNFAWTPSTGPNAVSNPNVYNPTVSPVSSTMYYFTSDCGTDSVLVNAAPPFTYDAGPGGNICQNGQVHLNATTDNLYAPYHFQWVPGTGLNDPLSNFPNDTVPNPVASPLVTTKYYCYITGNNGCTNLDSVTVNVSGSGSNIVAQASPTLVCPGTPVNLNIVTNPQSCGISQTPCQGHQVQATIGTGTGQTPAGSPTQYPTIYGHYSNSARHQLLFLQSELLAQLGSGGTIDSISFYISQINTANDTIRNFEIKMGCTQATSLSNWQPNLVTVFSPKNVPIGAVVGWKVHRLDFPYDWDGTSNLVVDICFNNPTSGALNNKMQMTPTPFNSVYYSKGNTSQCGNTGTPQASVNRPNTRFNACVTDVNGLPISWTPAVGPNAPVPSNIVNPTAYPESPVIYEVDVTAPNGCHSQDFVFVNVDTSLRFSAFPVDTFFCSPTSVTLTTVTSGSQTPPNSSYQWINLATNASVGTGPSITVSPSGSTDYLCTLNGLACVLHDTVRVVVGSSIPISLIVDSINCFGQSNGKITAVPSGGTPPLVYAWSTSATIDSIQNLSAGNYSVTITDSQGCSGNTSVTLSTPAQLSLSATVQNVTCNGANNGTVALATTGGTPGYNYLWNPAQPNAATATGLTPGNYTATVTDAFGCSASASASVSQPTIFSVSTLSFNATSFGGNEGWAFVIATGGTPGYTYTWSNGSSNDTIQNLNAGTYYVTVCDANGCCKQDTAIVSDPPPIILTFNTLNNVCHGDCLGSSSVTASGGIAPYSFIWSQGTVGDSIDNLCAGVYTVTATDSAGVTVSGNVNITEPSPISIQLDTTTITCFGANNASVLATATGGTGGFTYNWTGGGNINPNINLSPGTYTVTATDANHCTAQSSWTVLEPTQVGVAVSSIVNVSCFGGNDGGATANSTGGTPGYSYIWSLIGNASNSVSGFMAGMQYVTVTDANSCTASASFNITQPTQLAVSVTSTINVSCSGGSNGSVDISVTGGTTAYSFNWSDNSTAEDLNNKPANTYSVTVTDANNCTALTSTLITEPSAIILSFSHTDPLCAGDANGSCTVSASGGAAGYVYDWAYVPGNNDNNIVNSIPSGVYDVTVYDAAQCSATGSVTVTDPLSLNAQLINKQEISCANAQDGSVEVRVTGGTPPIAYNWSNSATTSVINNLAPGIYAVTVNDNNGCATILITTFNAPPAISIDWLSIDSASCPEYTDGSIQVSAIGGTPGSTAPYQYSIDGINFQSSEFFTELSAGIYTVLIRDSEGCTKDTTVTVGEPVKPILTILPQDSLINLGQSITLVSNLSVYGSADINYYSWSPISGLNCSDCSSVNATPYAHTEYTLTLNYLYDCRVTETITVYVGNGEDFFVPTAFSPNGDGNNDVFTVYGSGLAKVSLSIFNRWGEKIYDSLNQWAGWDGTYKGVLQNPGVYTYYISATYLNGKTRERKGTITMVR